MRSARSGRQNRKPDTTAPNVSAITPVKHASNDTLNTVHVAPMDATVSDRSHLHPNMYLPADQQPKPKLTAVKSLFASPRGSGKRERSEQRSVTPVSIAVSAADDHDEPDAMESKSPPHTQAAEMDDASPPIVVPNLSLLNATFNPEEDTHL